MSGEEGSSCCLLGGWAARLLGAQRRAAGTWGRGSRAVSWDVAGNHVLGPSASREDSSVAWEALVRLGVESRLRSCGFRCVSQELCSLASRCLSAVCRQRRVPWAPRRGSSLQVGGGVAPAPRHHPELRDFHIPRLFPGMHVHVPQPSCDPRLPQAQIISPVGTDSPSPLPTAS